MFLNFSADIAIGTVPILLPFSGVFSMAGLLVGI